MAKAINSPLISLAVTTGSPEMKDADGEKAKHKRLDKNEQVKYGHPIKDTKPKDAPMTVGANPTWKPPTHKDRLKMAAEDGHVSSMRKWVSGEISTKQHKENIKRSKVALGFKT